MLLFRARDLIKLAHVLSLISHMVININLLQKDKYELPRQKKYVLIAIFIASPILYAYALEPDIHVLLVKLIWVNWRISLYKECIY